MSRVLIGLIGLHSCVLGAAMLCMPGMMIRTLGFTDPIPVFFPSQSGIFLLILGLCYLYALKEPAYTKIILLSKALAVVFLVVHAALFSAPAMIWAAAAGDGAMLCALLLVLKKENLL